MRVVLLLALLGVAYSQQIFETCKPIALTPNVLADGGSQCSSDLDYRAAGNQCILSCAEGYVRNQTSAASTETVICYNGFWVDISTRLPVHFSCAAVSCGPPPVPNYATLTGSCSQTYNNSQNCHFNCNPGYQLTGFNFFTCQPNGVWSSNVGSCTQINACAYSPCNTLVSTCSDVQGSASHVCTCKQGYYGVPGADGNGCQKLQVVSDPNFGLSFVVGDGQDISFTFGSFQTSVVTLANAIDLLTSPLGTIPVMEATIQTLDEVTLPQLVVDIDDAEHNFYGVRASLEQQDTQLVTVTAAGITGMSTLTSMGTVYNSISATTLALSSQIATTSTMATNTLSSISSQISSDTVSAQALLTAESNELGQLEGILLVLLGTGDLLTNVAASLTPSTLQTYVTIAVKNETSNAMLREGNVSLTINSVSAAVSNVVSIAPSIEGNLLTVPNALNYIKCWSLFGYAFVNGLCVKVLADTGFVYGTPGEYYYSISTNTWMQLEGTTLDTSFDGNGFSVNNGIYTASTPGYYMLSANLAVYEYSTGTASLYFTAAQNYATQPPSALNTGVFSAQSAPGIYYSLQHAGGVFLLNNGDTLSLYYRSETSAMYFYWTSVSLALLMPQAQSGNAGFMAAQPAPYAVSGLSTGSTPILIKGSSLYSVNAANSLHNAQGAFSPTTGLFTAPIAGTYYFTATVGMIGHSGLFSLMLVKNSNAGQDVYNPLCNNVASKSYVGSTIDVSGAINMAVNDVVGVYFIPSTSSFTFVNVSFSGSLIKSMANRPLAVATPPSGGLVEYSYYFYPGYGSYSLGTTCSLCIGTTKFSSAGVFTVPYAGTYWLDLQLNMYGGTAWTIVAVSTGGGNYDSDSGNYFYLYSQNTYQNYHSSLVGAYSAGSQLGAYFYNNNYGWTLLGSSTFTVMLLAVTY